MTGSLAVVMAAVIPLRAAAEIDLRQAMRLLRHSRYTVSETLNRIEDAARDRGFSVLAVVPGTRPMLVLASAGGGTLVVMHDADSQPSMPMSLMVSPAAGGGADVLVEAIGGSSANRNWSDVPASVIDELQSVPGLVEIALAPRLKLGDFAG
jgi:hypothetical protein